MFQKQLVLNLTIANVQQLNPSLSHHLKNLLCQLAHQLKHQLAQ
jgi:hypothetical protein